MPKDVREVWREWIKEIMELLKETLDLEVTEKISNEWVIMKDIENIYEAEIRIPSDGGVSVTVSYLNISEPDTELSPHLIDEDYVTEDEELRKEWEKSGEELFEFAVNENMRRWDVFHDDMNNLLRLLEPEKIETAYRHSISFNPFTHEWTDPDGIPRINLGFTIELLNPSNDEIRALPVLFYVLENMYWKLNPKAAEIVERYS